MGKFVEFSVSDRKVSIIDNRLPISGAVCKALIEKGSLTPFGLAQMDSVKQASESTAETFILSDVRMACRSLSSTSPILKQNGDKYEIGDRELADQIVNASAGLTVTKALAKSAVAKSAKGKGNQPAKRGRPAGATANRGPKAAKSAKVQRFQVMDDGSKRLLGKGKPSPYWTIVDGNGNVLQSAVVKAVKVKTPKVAREPKAKAAKIGRFYMLDGVVTPFGAGRPSAVKLENECDSAGLHIENAPVVRRTPTSKKAVENQEVTALKSELNDLKAMMAMFLQSQGISMPTVTTPVVKPEVVETVVVSTPVVTEKPVKAPKSATPKAKSPKSKRVTVKAGKVNDDAELDDDADVELTGVDFTEESGDAGFSMGSDGFVVTDID